jgi:hypothetical protein
MHIDPTLAAFAGFLLGTILTSLSFVVSNSMTITTLKSVTPEPEYTFEPENEDIRISLDGEAE